MVVTLWYRAPELLLQCPYATLVDLWSVGAIMAEMYNRRPIFPGKSDVDQLHKILDIIGAPEKREWPDKSALPWENFRNCKEINLRHLVPDISAEGLDLLQNLLVFDPNKRFNAQTCLAHAYFDEFHIPDSQDSGISSKTDSSSSYRDLAKNEDPVTSIQQESNSSDDLFQGTDFGIGLGDTSSDSEGRTLSRTDSGICVSPPPSSANVSASEGTECCVNNNNQTGSKSIEKHSLNAIPAEDLIISPPRKIQRRGEYL